MSADAEDVQAAVGATDDVPEPQTNGQVENGQHDGAAGGNKFQQAISSWRNLDLTSLMSTLDTVAADMVTAQKDTLAQRKSLAEQTKAFRKLDDSGKLAEMKALTKAYQSYIDLISSHSKDVQAAFMKAYSPLSDVPDPYPLLEASVESVTTADELVPKLEGEKTQLQKQVAKLSSQLEETEKQLETERSARQVASSGQDDKIKDIESSWEAVLKEKQNNWESREKSLEEKIENQDRLLKELKASYEVSQRLGKAAGEDDTDEATQARAGASAAELEIINGELEKSQMRLAEVEARNEQLRLELAQSTSRAGQLSSISVEEDPAFLRLRSENSALLRKLDTAKYDRESEKSKITSSIKALEREIATLREDRESLKRKVDKYGDYEEVKQELDMLKAIEFSTGDDEASDNDMSATNGQSQSQSQSQSQAHGEHHASKPGESLEKLLLSRNKKLNDDLTLLRVAHNELTSRLSTLQEELSETNMDLDKSRALNETLESDLHKTQQEAMNAFDSSAMSVAGGTYSSRYHPKSSYAASTRRGGNTSPTSSIISGFDTSSSHSPRAFDSLRAESVSGGGGILPMITAQRDRFKQKIASLESDLQAQYSLVSSLRSEIAALQRDNLQLYERTRYVSSYARPQHLDSSSTSSTSYISAANTAGSAAGLPHTEQRYKSAYESSISPFAQFRGRESARALKRMSLPERALWRVTNMVLQTRTSRNLFAGYCLGLHLLVFVMLFWGVGGTGATTATAAAAAMGAGVGGGSGSGSAAAGAGVPGGGVAAGKGDWVQDGFQAGG